MIMDRCGFRVAADSQTSAVWCAYLMGYVMLFGVQANIWEALSAAVGDDEANYLMDSASALSSIRAGYKALTQNLH